MCLTELGGRAEEGRGGLDAVVTDLEGKVVADQARLEAALSEIQSKVNAAQHQLGIDLALKLAGLTSRVDAGDARLDAVAAEASAQALGAADVAKKAAAAAEERLEGLEGRLATAETAAERRSDVELLLARVSALENSFSELRRSGDEWKNDLAAVSAKLSLPTQVSPPPPQHLHLPHRLLPPNPPQKERRCRVLILPRVQALKRQILVRQILL